MTKRLWVLLAPFVALAACSDATTRPPMHQPQSPTRMMVDDCGDGCAPGDALDPSLVNLDTYPYVLDVDVAPDIVEFGNLPMGPSAMDASFDTPPACQWQVIENRPSGYTSSATGATIYRPVACADGPCYGEYLDARNAARLRNAGAVGGGIATAMTFVGPAGQVVRVVRVTASLVTTVGFVGWVNEGMLEKARYKLNQCVGRNGGFYQQTVIY